MGLIRREYLEFLQVVKRGDPYKYVPTEIINIAQRVAKKGYLE